MANGNQSNSDLVKWQIDGIRAERIRTQERLTYLEAAERRLTNAGLTGGVAKPKAGKPAATKTRKRRISPEARQKMREAAQRRWANKKEQPAAGISTGSAEIVPPPVA